MRIQDHRLQFVLIMIGAVSIRGVGLGSRPFWYDEAFSVLFTRRLRELTLGSQAWIKAVGSDVHPPGYYVLLSTWGRIWNDTLVSYRWFSVVLGMLVVVLSYVLAKNIFKSIPLATLAALIVSFSPFQVHYSQEVRMYSLLTVFMLTASILMLKMIEREGSWLWVPLGFAVSAGMYTHNLAIFFLLPLFASPLFLRKSRVGWFSFLAGILAVGLYSPWLSVVLTQLSTIQVAYWLQEPGIAELLRTLIQFISGLPRPLWALPFFLFCAIFIFLTLAVGLGRTLRKRDIRHWKLYWINGLWVVNVVILWTASQWQPLYLDRVLLPASVMVSISLAWLILEAPLSAPFRMTSAMLLGLGSLLGLFGYFTYDGFPFAPFEGVNRQISEEFKEHELILHTNKITAFPSYLYDPELPHTYMRDPEWSRSNTLSKEAQVFLDFRSVEDLDRLLEGTTGIWVVYFEGEKEDYVIAGEVEHPVFHRMEEDYSLSNQMEFNDLRLLYYTK